MTIRRECRTSGWLAQSKLVRMVLNKGEARPNWTTTQIANSLQVLERIGGDDGTRTRGLCRDRGD